MWFLTFIPSFGLSIPSHMLFPWPRRIASPVFTQLNPRSFLKTQIQNKPFPLPKPDGGVRAGPEQWWVELGSEALPPSTISQAGPSDPPVGSGCSERWGGGRVPLSWREGLGAPGLGILPTVQ